MNWFPLLIDCFNKVFKREIPFTIEKNELLVRAIVHPMFYSNKKNTVKREAFLPPSNKSDVSLLRHKYTNDTFCKRHAVSLKINGNIYCGLATFHAFNIEEIYNELPLSDKILVQIKGTPIDAQNKYVLKPPVYKNNNGLPMHADMLYDTPIIKGEPNTKHRQFAEKLAKTSKYFHDLQPDRDGWVGDKLHGK